MKAVLQRIADGRTDLVFEYTGSTIEECNALLKWCAYYGDVSALRFLLAAGASLDSLGDNYGLSAAAFHRHWRLCQFLLERGADANKPDANTGETPLHSGMCRPNNLVVRVLLAHGANPNCQTLPGIETGAFMRDCRTRAETALHRAAAFGDEETIQLLLDAGAVIDARDMNGDSPLTWASWHVRPTLILGKLLYGDFRIHPDHKGMQANLQGKPSL